MPLPLGKQSRSIISNTRPKVTISILEPWNLCYRQLQGWIPTCGFRPPQVPDTLLHFPDQDLPATGVQLAYKESYLIYRQNSCTQNKI